MSKRPSGGETADFRPDIEGLRAIAVLLVVAYHAGLAVPGGFIGVDVFFLISGFLITGLLLREHDRTGRISLINFYARRIRRIVPAASVVLVVTLIAANAIVAPLDRPAVSDDAAAAALSVANVRFALAAGDYFAQVGSPSPFLHFWSLGVEEQFYLLWPALILLVAGRGGGRRRIALLVTAVVVASMAANLVLTDTAVNWAFYSLPTRAWQLGLGALIAIGTPALSRLPAVVLSSVAWAGLVVIGASAMTLDGAVPYPGLAALAPSVGAAGVIAGASACRGPGALLSVPPLRFVGRISYSLYLWHWPVFVLAPIALGLEPSPALMGGLIVAAGLLSVLSWRLVETTARHGFPTLSAPPRRVVLYGVASIMAVVLMATGAAVMPEADSVVSAAPMESAPGASNPAIVGAVESAEGAADDLDPLLGLGELERAALTGTAAPPIVTVAGRPTGTAAPESQVTPQGTEAPAGTMTPQPTEAPASAVTPAAIKQARGDEERLRADGCLAFEPVTVPPDCVYGARNGSFVVALVGDSHAAQWFPAVVRIAKARSWRVETFVKVSCPFADLAVINRSLKREYRECEAFNRATLDRLGELRPDLTLVGISRVAMRPARERDDTVAARGAAIARMLDRIPGRVALLMDTPNAGRDIPSCLSAHRADVQACAIDDAVAFSHDFGAAEAVAAKRAGAALIDLTGQICATSPCPVVGRQVLFRDAEHLTASFARSLAPALARAIDEAMATSGGPTD